MRHLQGIDGEDGHGGVDTEALEAGEEGVGPHEEGDDIREGCHTHSNPGVTHGPAKQLR